MGFSTWHLTESMQEVWWVKRGANTEAPLHGEVVEDVGALGVVVDEDVGDVVVNEVASFQLAKQLQQRRRRRPLPMRRWVAALSARARTGRWRMPRARVRCALRDVFPFALPATRQYTWR